MRVRWKLFRYLLLLRAAQNTDCRSSRRLIAAGQIIISYQLYHRETLRANTICDMNTSSMYEYIYICDTENAFDELLRIASK